MKRRAIIPVSEAMANDHAMRQTIARNAIEDTGSPCFQFSVTTRPPATLDGEPLTLTLDDGSEAPLDQWALVVEWDEPAPGHYDGDVVGGDGRRTHYEITVADTEPRMRVTDRFQPQQHQTPEDPA